MQSRKITPPITLVIFAILCCFILPNSPNVKAATLEVPYFSQYNGNNSDYCDCGPTSLAMIIDYYGKRPGNLSVKDFVAEVRRKMEGHNSGQNSCFPTNEQEWITALSFYGIPAENIPSSPSNVDAKIQLMIDATRQGRPVVALIDVSPLGRTYDLHAYVVTGFSDDNQTVYINDPDNQSPRNPNWIQGGRISLSINKFRETLLSSSYSSYGVIPTVSRISYRGQLAGISYYNAMVVGTTQQAQVQLRNIGSATWDENTRLATLPRNEASPFYDATWIAQGRISSAGTTPPGGTATFNFVLKAPDIPGQYTISFAFLQENVTWFSEPSEGAVWFQVNVVAQTPRPIETNCLKPLLRYYNSTKGKHFYTTSWKELAYGKNGWVFERTEGYVAANETCHPGADLPLFRLWHSQRQKHYYTADITERDSSIREEGYVLEKIVGYVYSSVQNNVHMRPLYSSYNGTNDNHFYTIDSTQHRRAITEFGYTLDLGIKTYVISDERLRNRVFLPLIKRS